MPIVLIGTHNLVQSSICVCMHACYASVNGVGMNLKYEDVRPTVFNHGGICDCVCLPTYPTQLRPHWPPASVKESTHVQKIMSAAPRPQPLKS